MKLHLMKKLLSIILLVCIASVLLTCKKYDEGGLKRLTNKHLCGGNTVGDKKTWKLKLYEVDGVDSTNLIKNSNVSDFYDVTFELTSGKRNNTYFAYSIYRKFNCSVGITSNEFIFEFNSPSSTSIEDSLQCSSQLCYRNVFIPELYGDNSTLWTISKLTRNTCLIKMKRKHCYKLIFNCK